MSCRFAVQSWYDAFSVRGYGETPKCQSTYEHDHERGVVDSASAKDAGEDDTDYMCVCTGGVPATKPAFQAAAYDVDCDVGAKLQKRALLVARSRSFDGGLCRRRVGLCLDPHVKSERVFSRY